MICIYLYLLSNTLANPRSYSVDIKSSFSWEQSGRGVKLTNHLHRADVKKRWSYSCTAPYIFSACTESSLHLTLLSYLVFLSFIHSFFLSFIQSFFLSFIFPSFFLSFFLSFIHSFIRSFFLSLCQSFFLIFIHFFFLSFFLAFIFLSFFHSFFHSLSFLIFFPMSIFLSCIYSLFLSFFLSFFIHFFFHSFTYSFFLSLLQLRNIGLEKNKRGSLNDKSETGGKGCQICLKKLRKTAIILSTPDSDPRPQLQTSPLPDRWRRSV